MSFKNLNIKPEYRSFKDNIVVDFYIPILDKAILYRRAVGFFSSSALSEIAKGIIGLIDKGGRIELIASPNLSDKDVEAIDKGYKMRDEIIKKNLISQLEQPKNIFEEERLNLLAHLISINKLDIKIAILNKNNQIGMYHEKLGIVYDNEGNKIVFTGSLNESANALLVNYESIDVFTSWNDLERVDQKEKSFIKLWDNDEEGLQILEFPSIKEEIVKRYKKEKINKDFEFDNQNTLIKYNKCNNKPLIPNNIKFHNYQEEAILSWKKNNFKGIFDMATGTGKTFTGIGAFVDLYNHLNGSLAVIIVCPYTHLVEQWVEELSLFNIKPIIGYSEAKDKNYKKILKKSVFDYNLKVIDYFCFITTNATYSTEDIQTSLKKLKRNSLLIVDEAHNFGSQNLSIKLLDNFKYRLALSATLERHNDPEGTQALYDYFGDVCITYTLERAIKEGKLTPYYYHPIPVTLSDGELEKYKAISREMGKNLIKSKSGKVKLNEKGKRFALQRARIIAGAINKVSVLLKYIEKYKNDSHTLVYCGATTLDNDEIDDDFDIRQIDYITKKLGNEMNMKVTQFTSRENNAERALIKRKFEEGEDLQALIAIKCLDEGVNIPKIKTAFILASTTNPKEYIQRRGRVLRLAPGKIYAEIYDFITLPRELDTVKGYIEDEIKYDRSLARNEIKRIKEFRNLSLNPYDSDMLIDEIEEAYNLIENNKYDFMEEI